MKRLITTKNMPWILCSLTVFLGVVIAEIPEQRYVRVLIAGAVMLAYFFGGLDGLCFCINHKEERGEIVA